MIEFVQCRARIIEDNTRIIDKMEKDMAMVLNYGLMGIGLKASFSKIKKREKGNSRGLMAIPTKVTLKEIRCL